MMRGWSGRARLWATIVLALAALMICGVASAGDDATVERFNAEVVVTRDGALEFTETLTYYVSDDINGFTRDIDPSFGSGIEDFGVKFVDSGEEFAYNADARNGDSGVFDSVRLSNGLERYYVYLPCRYGSRVTLEYRYTLPGVCARYRDVGVLDFPLLGDGWEMDIDEYSARVSFEQGAAADIDVRINSAGMALDGAATGVRDGAAYFKGVDAGDGNALRVRIMFPSELLPDMAYTEDVDMAETILRQEAELDALTQSNRQHGIIWLCAIVLACVALCVMAQKWWDADPYVELDEYRTGAPLPLEPGVTPAEIRYAAMHMNADQDALAATMLDLVRRGYLRIEGDDEPEYVYDGQMLDGCTEHERYALEWILGMGDGHRVTFKQIKKNSRCNAYASGFSKWTNIVRASAQAHAWYEKRSRAQIYTGVVLIVAFAMMTGVSVWNLSRGSAYETLGLCQVFSAVALLLSGIFALVLSKRTPEGARVAGAWNSVRAWVRGDWNANELPPDSGLLEQLMVYALVLGVSDKLAAKLNELDPSYTQAMLDSSNAMRMFGVDNSMGFAAYGYYCTRAHSCMSMPSGSSGGGSSSGAGGGGGGGTF